MYHRLSTTKINKIILCFVEDITATATAKILGVNRSTVNRYFNIILEKIFKESLKKLKKKLELLNLMKLILEQKEFEVKGEGGNSWQNTSLWTSKTR